MKNNKNYVIQYFKLNILWILLSFFSCEGFAKEVFVSPTGNDNNSGTINEPVKSLSKAFEMVKGDAEGSKIWLREGIHNLNQVVELSSEHSGSTGASLEINAYQGEKAIINGGTAIPTSKFRLLTTESRLNRLPEVARGRVYIAQLFESEYSSKFPSKQDYNQSAQISWNGYVLNEAQYPNRGYAYIETIIDEGPTTRWLAPGESPEPYSETNPTGGKFILRDQLDWDMMTEEFDRTHDMLIKGYFSNDWYFETERIGDITSGGNIQLLRYLRYGVEGKQKLPRRVNIYGALCQLDEPGEWYYDKAENLLYVWPVQPISDDNPFIISGKNKLINCEERIDNVQFKNLVFENFSDHAIRFVNAGNIDVLGCEFRSGNGLGVRLQGDNNQIKSCDFHDSKQAFVLSTYGNSDVVNLINGNNQAVNNHIHHLWLRGYGAFAIGGVGTRFANNLIHDMNGALVYGTVDCVVEFNEFYNMGYEMGDWNPMYRGADFHSYNNQIRYNFIHHLMETPYGYPIAGVRNDDAGHGTRIHHNVFYKSGRSATAFKGSANTATNNIVLETSYMWWTNQVPYETLDKSLWSTKGDFFERRYQEYIDNQDKIAAGTLNPNDKSNFLGRAENFISKEFWNNNQLWKEHFPIIDKLYHFDDPAQNPWGHCYDTITNNVMVNGRDFPFHIHGPNNIDAGGIESTREWLPTTALIDMPEDMTADQIFNDFENMDIRLKSSFDKIEGFIDFNMDTIGLFIDEYRTEMPNKKEYRMAVKNKYNGVPSSGGTFGYDLLNQRYSEPEYFKLIITSSKQLKNNKQLFEVKYSSEDVMISPKVSIHNTIVELYRITGEKVRTMQDVNLPLRFNNREFHPGIYIIHVSDRTERQIEKIILR